MKTIIIEFFFLSIISIFVNAQTVTATRNNGAGSIVLNCDGVDDHIQINEALEYVKDEGGLVALSANTFVIDSVLWFAGNNTTLQGAGINKTTIKLVDDAHWCYYYSENSSWILHHAGPMIMNKKESMNHLTIEGLKIDGNKYAQYLYNPETGDTIRSPQLDGQGHYVAVEFVHREGSTEYPSDITFSYVNIFENNGDGFVVHKGKNINVNHCIGLKGGHSYIYFLDPINLTVEDNDFEVTSNSGIRWYDGNHIVVRNNHVYGEYAKTGNSNFCIEVTSGQAATITDDVIIENNRFEFTAGAAIALDAKESVAAKNVVIRNNIILQCGNTGTSENIREAGGINIKNFTNTLIENNTIVNCIGGGIRIGGNTGFNTEWSYETGLTAVIKNNIITNTINGGNNADSYGIDIAKGNSVVCTFNNLWDNHSGDYNGCESARGGISVDPKFKSIKLGTQFHDTNDKTADLHLQSESGSWNDAAQIWEIDTITSKCINGGDPVSGFANELIPNGNRINLGAYGNTEFASKGSKSPPIADAGKDQYIRDDDGDGIVYVNLNGSNSSDDGSIVSYVWIRNNIQIASGVTPSSVPFVLGKAEVMLTVTDNDGITSSDKVNIVINPSGNNIAPTADAGEDIIVTDMNGTGSASVTLSAENSFDEDGEIIKYSWLENGSILDTNVTATINFDLGIHFVLLQVTDNEGGVGVDTVKVEVKGSGNYSLSFNDNSNDEVVLITGLPVFSTFTIEMWIKQITSTDDTDGLLSFGGDGKRLTLKTANHQPTWGESSDAMSENGLSINEWHHIAFVVKNDSLNSIYIDGVAQNIVGEKSISIPGNSWGVASYYGSGASNINFTGKIDELRYWNYERSSTEINDNKDKELIGNENGLVSYWNFNDGSGNKLTDKAGGHNGTLVNMESDDWVLDTPFTPTSVNENSNNFPNEFVLYQNYPNPFNPSTVIKYYLPKSENIEISVFNILGEKVSELVNAKMNAGYHSVTFDGSNLSNGIYFYKISANNFRKVRKMILLK